MNKKIDWIKEVEREGDFWKNYMVITAITQVGDKIGYPINKHLIVRHKNDFIHYKSQKSLEKFEKNLLRRITDNKLFFSSKIVNGFQYAARQLLSISEEIQQTDLKRIDNQKLYTLYEKFSKGYQAIYPWFYITICYEQCEKEVRNWFELKKIGLGKTQRYLSVLLTPTMKNYLIHERDELIRIVINYKKDVNSDSCHRLLFKHYKKYTGLPVLNENSKPWSFKYFQQEFQKLNNKTLEVLIEIDKRNRKKIEDTLKNQNKIYREIEPPQNIKNYIEFLKTMSWMRLESRNILSISQYNSRKLFNELATRCSTNSHEIKFFIPSELKNLLINNKKIDSKILENRKRVSVLLYRNNKVKILEGDSANKFIKKEIEQKELEVKGIKGSTACVGVYVGKVTIIMNQAQQAKMKKNRVLVTRMTNPDFVSAIRQAGAIVTDEGGITCHAALISREFNIPCITGTKNATQVLKDGDLIEVDADKGVVKIIESKK